jgi:hypothetical protein
MDVAVPFGTSHAPTRRGFVDASFFEDRLLGPLGRPVEHSDEV